jgi:hypothetical protein
VGGRIEIGGDGARVEGVKERREAVKRSRSVSRRVIELMFGVIGM